MPDVYVAALEVEGILRAFGWDESEHPRGKTTEESTPGSFAPKAGVAASDPATRKESRERVTDELMAHMWEQFNKGEDIGFSYQPIMETSPTDGFMVTKYPERALIINPEDEGPTTDDIEYFIEQNADLWRGDPEAHIGGWLDTSTGKFYLDVSTRRGSLDDALNEAVDLGEIAVWDVANKRQVNVKDEIDKWARRVNADPERVNRYRKRLNLAATRALRLPAQCDANGDCRGHTQDAGEVQPRFSSKQAFSRAEARVAFAVIEQRSDTEERNTVPVVSRILTEAVLEALGGDHLLAYIIDNPAEIPAVAIGAQATGKIKRAFSESLARAYFMGREFAITELDLARATAVQAFRTHGFAWREEDHPRGKTTEPSTPGSFAPKDGATGVQEPAGDISRRRTIAGVPVEDITSEGATTIGGEFNPDEWRKKGMAQARKDWQKLGLVERDRMAAADQQIEARAAELLGDAEFPNTGDAGGDIDAYVDTLSEFMPREDRGLLKDYGRTLLEDMQGAGVDDAAAREYALELTRLIAAQDFEAAGRTLGDHGVHHIIQDLRMAREILDADPDYAHDPAKVAALSIAVALHDIGYMTYPARLFLDDLHGHWSAVYYNAAHFERVAEMLGEDVATSIGQWIEYHDTTTIDFESFPELSALGIADNFALFHHEKMPPMLRSVPANVGVLTRLAAGKISLDQAHDAMRFNIAQANIPDRLKAQLSNSIDEVSGVLPKYTLGMVGAKVGSIEWASDHPRITLERYRANEALGKIVDFNGKQFHKLAETYRTNADDFVKSGRLLLRDHDGKVKLEALIKVHLSLRNGVTVKFADLRDQAVEYLEANGFRMAGNLTDGARAIIQDELLNGVRMGLRAEDVRVRIWERLIRRGFVGIDDVFATETRTGVLMRLEYLMIDDAAGDRIRLWPHYIETLVRTNTFEALNEARLAEYTDPAVTDFVVALEYSAILDNRTTVLCQSLDGFTRSSTDPVWEIYNPPNHYNCRSLLIPITAIDGWDGEESPYPALEPQVGFFSDAMRNVVRLFHYPGGQAHDQQTHGNWADGTVNDITSHYWKDGEIGLVKVPDPSQLSPTTSGTKLIEVLKNPTQREIDRWAGRDVRLVRWAIDYATGNYAIWDASEMIHGPVAHALGIETYGSVSTNADDPHEPSTVLGWIHDAALAGLRSGDVSTEEFDQLVRRLTRTSFALTFHTPGGKEHDQKSHGNWADGNYVGDTPIGGDYPISAPSMGVLAWAGQVGQHPDRGKPGMSYTQNKVDEFKIDTLLWRDDKGILRGLLYHYPQDVPGYEKKGNVTLMVDPLRQRQGIGSKLLREAGKRWNINLWNQDYTPEGAALAKAVTHPDLTQPPKYDKQGWIIHPKVGGGRRKHSRADFHTPGGHEHDQRTHGNWANGAYGLGVREEQGDIAQGDVWNRIVPPSMLADYAEKYGWLSKELSEQQDAKWFEIAELTPEPDGPTTVPWSAPVDDPQRMYFSRLAFGQAGLQVNAFLRYLKENREDIDEYIGARHPSGEYDWIALGAAVKSFDVQVDNSRMYDNATLFRTVMLPGVADDELPAWASQYANAKPGSKLTNPGYSSWTVDLKDAMFFADRWNSAEHGAGGFMREKPIILVQDVKAGFAGFMPLRNPIHNQTGVSEIVQARGTPLYVKERIELPTATYLTVSQVRPRKGGKGK
jgi:SPP1 gp7 family putative phage head morphogenesis protein